jgi:hypothetical protein
MASKPRPNKSFLLRLENLPDEVRQATKDRTSPIKRPKIETRGLLANYLIQILPIFTVY